MGKVVFRAAARAASIGLIPFFGSVALAATSASPAPAQALNPEIMGKMLKLIAEQGVDREMLSPVANALGLTASGQTWASRSVTFQEDNGALHGFYISRGADPDLVISVVKDGRTIYAYRAQRDGTATAAVVFDTQSQQITMRAPAESQDSLDVELALWSSVAGGNN